MRKFVYLEIALMMACNLALCAAWEGVCRSLHIPDWRCFCGYFGIGGLIGWHWSHWRLRS